MAIEFSRWVQVSSENRFYSRIVRNRQIRTQDRIQEIVPNLRFLLIFRGNFTLLSVNFKVRDKKSLSFGGVCAFQWIDFFCFR